MATHKRSHASQSDTRIGTSSNEKDIQEYE